VNLLLEDPAFAAAQREAGLSGLRAAGGTLARTDALWEATEPAPPVGGRHRYDWAFNDQIASALASHGLRWLPVIDYSPPWAQSLAGVDHSPPRSLADYAAYAAAVAARYGPGGAFWTAHPTIPPDPLQLIEIWNEPDNSTFWHPAPDPAGYAAMYGRARAAVAAAAPSVRVLIGGLTAGGAGSFLSSVLSADPGLARHIDGVSIHPYGHTPALVIDRIRSIRAAMAGLGLGDVPLYVTEVGWTTQPRGWHAYLPERLRPGYLAATLSQLGHLDCGLAAVVAYTWVSQQSDPANGEQWYGIASPAGGPSPDSQAFALGVRAAESPGPRHAC
jgi:polysaccharide biosynthesis protein PslG